MPNVILTRQQQQRQQQRGARLPEPTRGRANRAASLLPQQTGYMDGAPRMSMQGFGVIVGTAPKVALHMNVNRGYLYLQNNSTDDLYVSFDVRPNPKTALVIGAGGYYEPRVCPTNMVWVMSATLDNAQVNVVEGVLR